MGLPAFALASLTAIGLSAMPLGPSLAQTTVELAMWQQEEAGIGTWWKEIIAAFETANPDVKISITNVPYPSFIDQMTVRFASGRPPGLITMVPVNVGMFAAQDWLSPLDSRLEGTPVGGTDWTTLQQELVWDGKTMGVLLNGGPVMLYVNEKILGDGGVAVPTSYEEYITAVGKLTNPDKGIYGLSTITTDHPNIVDDFHMTVRWQGGEPVKDGKYNLTDPAVVAAAEKWRNMVKGGAPLGNNSAMARQQFADGKTAFMLEGPWIWPVVMKGPAEVQKQIAIVATPFGKNLGGGVTSLEIPSGNDQTVQDAAWRFIAFTMDPKWQQRLTALTFAPSALKTELPADVMNSQPVFAAMTAANVNVEPRLPPVEKISANYGEYRKIVMTAAVKLLSTDVPTADVLAEAQQQLEQAVPLN